MKYVVTSDEVAVDLEDLWEIGKERLDQFELCDLRALAAAVDEELCYGETDPDSEEYERLEDVERWLRDEIEYRLDPSAA